MDTETTVKPKFKVRDDLCSRSGLLLAGTRVTQPAPSCCTAVNLRVDRLQRAEQHLGELGIVQVDPTDWIHLVRVAPEEPASITLGP